MTGHHISSAKFLWGVASVLIFLTILTVGITWFHIPAPWNLVVAIAIAVVKATIVAAFFMNLYWDTKFNVMLLILSLIFLAILIGLTLIDTLYRTDPIPGF